MAENLAEKAYELGKIYERDYRGCSQCLIAALHDTFNLRNDDVFKAATGLAGGGSRSTDGSCGAYAGGIMILSSLVGRERDKFSDSEGIRFQTMDLCQKLHDAFIQEYGTVICRDIQTKVMGRPFYLPDPDEFKKFEESGAHTIHCLEVVGKAAKWVAEIIQQERLIEQSS